MSNDSLKLGAASSSHTHLTGRFWGSLMAYRRKIIDRRTREGKALGGKLDVLKVLAVLGLGAAFLGSRHHQDHDASRDSQGALVEPAQAAAAEPLALSGKSSAGMRSDGLPDPRAPATGSMTTRVVQTPVARADVGLSRQSVPWRHVTTGGVRWSLRRLTDGASMLLVLDLGDNQPAYVNVPAAFETLGAADINGRIDRIRTLIGQQPRLQTANYSYDLDGAIRELP